MRAIVHQAGQGIVDVREAAGQFSVILEQVHAMLGWFGKVQAGVESQAQGAEQITYAMGQLSETIQQTAENLRLSSEALQSLHFHAQEMQSHTARFQVN